MIKHIQVPSVRKEANIMQSPKMLIKLKKAQSEFQKGNYLKSVSACKKILEKDQGYVLALKLLITSLIKLNRFSEAEIALNKAIKLVNKEESYPLLHLLGCNYISQGKNDKALSILEKLFNETGDSKILLDIGLSYFKLRQFENARDVYLKLIQLEPDNHDAKRNLFPILFRLKEYQAAWTCFHSRIELPEIKDKVHWFAPQWSGESLVGKNILIFPEQGIGDNLDYTGCFAQAIADAKKTYIICDDRLQGLYKYNYPTAEIIPLTDIHQKQAVNAELDLQILAGSLSYLYLLDQKSIANKPKLTISPELIEPINNRLSNNKLRVGISWYHGRINDGNEFSMYLDELLPMLKIEGIEWVNLQFGDWKGEVESVQKKHDIDITHFEDCSAAGDFNRYGALIANCDLVISSSNAALMFASRLGVKNWMFLPTKQEGFKYNANQDSLAIKNTRVFYKDTAPNWGAVVEHICDEIKALLKLSTEKTFNE